MLPQEGIPKHYEMAEGSGHWGKDPIAVSIWELRQQAQNQSGDFSCGCWVVFLPEGQRATPLASLLQALLHLLDFWALCPGWATVKSCGVFPGLNNRCYYAFHFSCFAHFSKRIKQSEAASGVLFAYLGDRPSQCQGSPSLYALRTPVLPEEAGPARENAGQDQQRCLECFFLILAE